MSAMNKNLNAFSLNLKGKSRDEKSNEESKEVTPLLPEDYKPNLSTATLLHSRIYDSKILMARSSLIKRQKKKLFSPRPPALKRNNVSNKLVVMQVKRMKSTQKPVSKGRSVIRPVSSPRIKKLASPYEKFPTNPETSLPPKQAITAMKEKKMNKKNSITVSSSSEYHNEFKTFMEAIKEDPLYNSQLINKNSFYYLSPKNDSAYDLKIIESTEVDSRNYLTLTENGILHVVEDTTDFTPMEQFEREYYLFHLVSKLNFFKLYRRWKNFTCWRKNVRTCKLQDAKQKLEQNLFILNPVLSESLLRLREYCFEITDSEEYKLYMINNSHTYSLEEFCRHQNLQKVEITRLFKEFSSDVRKLVKESCETTLRIFLNQNGFSKTAKEKIAATTVTASPSNHTPNVVIKDKGISFTERAAMRTQCRKLSKYIRLCDFLIVDAFLSLALICTEELLLFIDTDYSDVLNNNNNLISSPTNSTSITNNAPTTTTIITNDNNNIINNNNDSNNNNNDNNNNNNNNDNNNNTSLGSSTALFTVEMVMEIDSSGTGGLSFEPKAEEFKVRLEGIIYDALKIVTSPERLLTHTSLSHYVQPAIDEFGALGEGLDLEVMIIEDKKFQTMVDQINDKLSEAFDAADTYAEIFEPYLESFLENQIAKDSINLKNYLNSDLEVFSKAIEKYSSQIITFNGIPISSSVGNIDVDSIQLKSALLPSPTQCLDKITDLLPKIAQVKTEALLEELQKSHEKISSIPISVDAFVQLNEHISEVGDKMECLDERHTQITLMYYLMEEYSIKVSDDQTTSRFMLTQANNLLKTTMQLSEDKIGDNITRFAKELDDEIPKLHFQIAEAGTKLAFSQISDPESDAVEIITFLTKVNNEVNEFKNSAEKYSKYQEVLRMPSTSWENLESLEFECELKLKLWKAYQSWGEVNDTWKATTLKSIDIDSISDHITRYLKIALQAERNLMGNLLAPKFKSEVNAFKSLLPVLRSLLCDSLQPRHWDRIHNLTGFKILGDNNLTVGKLLDMNVGTYAPEIETIATEAIQEGVLEGMLDKIKGLWELSEFEIKPYKNVKDTYILGNVEENVAQLDESLVNINTILGSRYVTNIQQIVMDWQKNLVLFQDTLDEWLNCQRTWMYLENIFSAPDIQIQLKNESKSFSIIDQSWKKHMLRTWEDPHAFQCATKPGLLEVFQKHNSTLDHIQKRLEEYLETKRQVFPRFYFLSNDELLEILAESKDPHAVQPHLRKCFDNLVKLEFSENSSTVDIKAMLSYEGERVPLGRNLKVRGSVEQWLTSVEEDMRKTLHMLMKHALSEYGTTSRRQWITSNAGQVVATVSQIMWARDVERAITSPSAHKELEHSYEQNVLNLTALTTLVRGKLSKLHRKVIVALITVDVHARDIVEDLWKSRVESTQDFKWQQQLRFYWDQSIEDVITIQSSSRINYGYEYEGCASRLVITPLTDRCWMTLTGALAMKLGGSPSGPAGTGKTESSKDLAKTLGIQCIVFNCSDQIDYKMMGKLFSGLAQAGCWGCFDEFNRIDIEVLSVISQQLLILRQGRLSKTDSLLFESRDITLRGDMHVIITMNPGYAGRTELPDNLKVLFRPVAMMVPDYTLIAEIMLFAEGFDDAKNLSKKMTKLYKLSSEQLSQQCHYDYGLRAARSVLVMAGSLKRDNPHLNEDVVLIRAMRDSNVPKFLSDDLPLFFGILADLFPGVPVPYQDTGILEASILREISSSNLQPVHEFVKKIIQLYETMHIRFGVTIVGGTGAGKTTAYQVLAKALTSLRREGSSCVDYQNVSMNVLNPKCITMGELYGESNEITQEWTDGLGSKLIREAVKDASIDKKWIIFDGPIDALWIENMNTVLDDNQTLCLANGERIKLKSQMRMLFEVKDLDVASPATVSRLGVVYMTSIHLPWVSLVKTWASTAMRHVHPWFMRRLMLHIQNLVQPGIDFVRQRVKEPVPTCDSSLARSMCALLESLVTQSDCRAVLVLSDAALSTLQPNVSTTNELNDDDDDPEVKFIEAIADKIFAFSYIWSIGATMSPTHELYSDFLDLVMDLFVKSDLVLNLGRSLLQDVYLEFKLKENNSKSNSNFSSNSITKKIDVTFTKWESKVPSFVFDSKTPFFQLMVPTVHTVCYSHLIECLMKVDKPVFFTGVTGTGKTVILKNLLSKLSKPEHDGGENLLPTFIGFSAQTSARVTQATIESRLQKQRKTMLGPPPTSKKVIIVVDDVNMPAVEQYGSQPPIELLRQFLDFKGFYDREKHFWKDIVNTVLLVAAAPPGGGRNHLSSRFVRHFNVLCLPNTSEESISKIFGAIVNGFLTSFVPEIFPLSNALVNSTIEIYKAISTELLPTPSKCHYTFNLRDVSKIFQGILMVRPRVCKSVHSMTRLWIHETMRIFHDRLTNQKDKLWLTEYLTRLCHRNFKVSWTHDELFGLDALEKPLIWCHFLRPGCDEPVYEETKSLKQITTCLEGYLDDYNCVKANKMNLVLFSDAVKHVSRICRVLRQPRGNAMLIGVGGSGKQSLTRLAASINEMTCRQIELRRGYGMHEFREDLKEIMIEAGVEGKNIAFLMTDTQIINEAFLEDINTVLNTGEVPNLFNREEEEDIISNMRPVMKRLGLVETRDNCKNIFIHRVRDNLHIILCMSPVGDLLRVRCRQFPSLINCCTIDWYMQWPEEALASVATSYFKDLVLPSEDVKSALISLCVTIHTSFQERCELFYESLRRRVYTTPKSYLDLIYLYLTLLKDKRTEVENNLKRLSTGVTKLEATNDMVAGLRSNLQQLQPVLIQKTEETEILLKEVAIEQAAAAKVQEKVSTEEAIVKRQANQVAILQTEAQKDLDVALPALEKAVKSLDALDKAAITEVKRFISPPPAVQTVMEAVCLLLGEKQDWDAAKKVLGDTRFMERLKQFDKDNISSTVLRKLKKYVKKPEMSYDNVVTVSKAASSLCMWVHAMDVYAAVAKDVEPKKLRLKEMDEQYKKAFKILAEKQAVLAEVVSKVNSLKKKCDECIRDKKRLKAESAMTKARLVRAEKLTAGLASEGVRWKRNVIELTSNLENLVGDVFISAACISYYGAFTGSFRSEICSYWTRKIVELHVPVSSTSYSLSKCLGDPLTIKEWESKGLPSDMVSTNNAILVTYGKRWPIMIDPQGQANKWIKRTEMERNIAICKMGHPDMLRILATCIRNGRPLLLEDLTEQLDPSLEPVLNKQVNTVNGRSLIRVGDDDIDYDPKFKLYMTTKMPNPHYLPEVFIKATIINFTVTFDGLEDQLLGVVVKKENPEVENRRNVLVSSMAADKKQLKVLEKTILKMLNESGDGILDDEELINTLADSKQTAIVIEERVAESEKTEIQINLMRNQYRPVAIRASLIYFVIADLANIDPMYQYSLEYFNRLFEFCIDSSEPSDNLDTRLRSISDFTTRMIYSNICRGLFEAHKVLFSFLVCTSILRHKGDISNIEWNLFIRGSLFDTEATGASYKVSNPAPHRIDNSTWSFIGAIEDATPALEGLVSHIAAHWENEWLNWVDCDSPHISPLPSEWNERMNAFQKMLLLKAFREEKVIFSVLNFVEMKLGNHFTQSPSASMEEIHRDMNYFTPCVFILSSGADPTGILLRFARERRYQDRLHVISLGQGQGVKAEALLQKACKSGDWVLLQNCHLSKTWMPSLEKIVLNLMDNKNAESSSGMNIHEDFRLFLTSMPAEYFPVPVLQLSVKLTNEPPKGLKANLLRTYNNTVTSALLDSCEGTNKQGIWRKLVFSLSFFHACIQERRKFGALGWNIKYDFNDSDLETSLSILKNFLSNQKKVPWDALRYVTGQINYGGRVTDDWDRRTITSILEKYYCEDAINENFILSDDGQYFIPRDGSHDSYLDCIESFPSEEHPSIYGMHSNANISFQMKESGVLLNTILSIQPRVASSSSGISADDAVLVKISSIKGQVPSLLDVKKASSSTFVTEESGLLNSLSTVLQQEIKKFNRLIDRMRSTLAGLENAIKGLVVMSKELDTMYVSFMNSQVPSIWSEVAYPSLKPLGSWVKDLIERVTFFRKWIIDGKPHIYPLPVFFFPQGFMTGVLQVHARKYKIPINSLDFSFKVYDIDDDVININDNNENKSMVIVPENGVIVSGLWIEGARWDTANHQLADSIPGEMFSKVPPIHFLPVTDYKRNPGDYACPLYKTSQRFGILSTTGISTNFIVAVDLPTDKDPNFWIYRGVAFLANLDF